MKIFRLDGLPAVEANDVFHAIDKSADRICRPRALCVRFEGTNRAPLSVSNRETRLDEFVRPEAAQWVRYPLGRKPATCFGLRLRCFEPGIKTRRYRQKCPCVKDKLIFHPEARLCSSGSSAACVGRSGKPPVLSGQRWQCCVPGRRPRGDQNSLRGILRRRIVAGCLVSEVVCCLIGRCQRDWLKLSIRCGIELDWEAGAIRIYWDFDWGHDVGPLTGSFL